jgi:hypothetical protein
MAKINTALPHPEPGTIGNITIYFLNGQLIARTIGKRTKKRNHATNPA